MNFGDGRPGWTTLHTAVKLAIEPFQLEGNKRSAGPVVRRTHTSEKRMLSPPGGIQDN
jgi:hypothetical protein